LKTVPLLILFVSFCFEPRVNFANDWCHLLRCWIVGICLNGFGNFKIQLRFCIFQLLSFQMFIVLIDPWLYLMPVPTIQKGKY
jgi:hypothetical protein